MLHPLQVFVASRRLGILRNEGDAALGDILAIWPAAEASLLRQWIRQHPKEIQRGNESTREKAVSLSVRA